MLAKEFRQAYPLDWQATVLTDCSKQAKSADMDNKNGV